MRNKKTFQQALLSNDKCSVTCSHTHTQMHTHFLSLTDKHTHPLSHFPCVSAVSSLQCNSPHPPPPLPPHIPYNRISIARLAAVCKQVCLWTSVCLAEALQGHCHGNLSMESSRSAVTEHRSQGSHEMGGCRGIRGGWRVLQCLEYWRKIRGPTRVGRVLECVFRLGENNEAI